MLGIELFERAAEARGRLLRVEMLVASGGDPDPRRAPGFVLTFDIGRILVVVDPAHARLVVRAVQSAEEIESIKRLALDEEEPWWKILGNPLTRVWPGGTGAGAESGAGDLREVRLQLREDRENPKVVSLRAESDAVIVTEEATHGG